MRRLLIVALWCVGCEDGAQIGQLRPKMVLDPPPGTTLVFDPMVIGFSKSGPKIIEVENQGAAPLQLGWRVEGPGPARVSSFPKNLEAGKKHEIWVRSEPVAPTSPEPTRLIVESNDPTQPEVSYPLELNAREPCRLAAWPDYIRFRVGDVATIGLLAAGSAPCEVRRLSLDEELFEIVEPETLPLVIASGQELPVRLRHRVRTYRPGIPIRELRIGDQDGQEVKVKLEAALPIFDCLTAEPEHLTFFDVPLGEYVDQPVTLKNHCNDYATIRSAGVFLGYQAYSVPTPLPQTIPPLGALNVVIRFKPAYSAHVGTIYINTDDSLRTRFEIGAVGYALLPGMKTLPALDLGPVGFVGSVPSACGSRIARLPVWSTGPGPLLIYRLAISGPDAAAFEYLGAEIDLQSVAGPNDELLVPVGKKAELLFRFRPIRGDPPRHDAQVSLSHFVEEGPRTVALVGWATDLALRSESQVVGPEKVDLLVAVDNSRSMQTEQERLVVAAANFVNAADNLGADYQLAVAIAESSSPWAGELLGCIQEDPVVRSTDGTTAERGARFGCMMRTGRRGEFQQSGWGAAQVAVQRALFPTPENPSTEVNARFLRPDTRLVFLAASDEDDGSTEEVADLLDYLRAARGGRVDRFQAHALAGTPGQPCADDPFLNPGHRYLAMTTLAGGAFYEICTPDYGPYFTDLAARAFAPSGVFILSGSVEPPSLRVELDGAVLSPGPDYSYDPAARTVSLTTSPGLGQVITATYRGECLP